MKRFHSRRGDGLRLAAMIGLVLSLSQCAHQEEVLTHYHRVPTYQPPDTPPRPTVSDYDPSVVAEARPPAKRSSELGPLELLLLGAVYVGLEMLDSDNDDDDDRVRILRKKGYIDEDDPSPFKNGRPTQFGPFPTPEPIARKLR